MSVSQTHYIIYGLMLDEKELKSLGETLLNEDWAYSKEMEKYHRGFQGFKLVVDGMSGKYAIFGSLIAESEESDGFDLTELSDDIFKDKWENYSIVSTFNSLFKKSYTEASLRLYIFTHFY